MKETIFKIKSIVLGLLSRDLTLELNYKKEAKHN
jgi:hypothetical protein